MLLSVLECISKWYRHLMEAVGICLVVQTPKDMVTAFFSTSAALSARIVTKPLLMCSKHHK